MSPSHLDRKTVAFAPGVTAEFVYMDAPGVAPDGFLMGSPESEPGRFEDEAQFRAVLTKGYWLQTTQVTQAQWQAVMGSNPSSFDGGDGCAGGPQHPVESVSWDDCQEFMACLRARGIAARLPTEAEWEFACRAGTTTAYSFGNDPGELDASAWHWNNSGYRTHPVGMKRPNAWALQDMHGNVWEWCQDWEGAYPSDRAENPAGPVSGDCRVSRGGSCFRSPRNLRSASREGNAPTYRCYDLGVRVALNSE